MFISVAKDCLLLDLYCFWFEFFLANTLLA